MPTLAAYRPLSSVTCCIACRRRSPMRLANPVWNSAWLAKDAGSSGSAQRAPLSADGPSKEARARERLSTTASSTVTPTPSGIMRRAVYGSSSSSPLPLDLSSDELAGCLGGGGDGGVDEVALTNDVTRGRKGAWPLTWPVIHRAADADPPAVSAGSDAIERAVDATALTKGSGTRAARARLTSSWASSSPAAEVDDGCEPSRDDEAEPVSSGTLGDTADEKPQPGHSRGPNSWSKKTV
mmetsp:Transcript_1830/g.5833  ORF Transcript_1830/g.5833 Transcript_1830/m.5833 type:complete len:239 (+) Transcript_1830:441-1157(+)